MGKVDFDGSKPAMVFRVKNLSVLPSRTGKDSEAGEQKERIESISTPVSEV